MIKFFPHAGHVTVWFWTDRAWIPAIFIQLAYYSTYKNQKTALIFDISLWTYCKCHPISFTHSKWIVCPQGKTVMPFIVSKRNCMNTTSYWIVKQTYSHFYLIISSFETYFQADRAIVMHCFFHANVWILHQCWVTTSWWRWSFQI